MSVTELVPRSVPLIMGTEALADEARKRQSGEVWTIEPPIDVVADNPDIDGQEFRRRIGVREGDLLLVTVSRLAIDLKIDALVRAIDATSELALHHPVRLAVVGDGEARSALAQRANSVNDRHNREVISLTGPTLDPRAAYAAADIVLGMGSSSLRAMSIRRPVIVQGEGGFSLPMTRENEDYFLRNGFYGVGQNQSGVADLVRQVADWIASPTDRHDAAAYGRRLVEERFNLSRATLLQLSIYEEVLRAKRKLGMTDLIKPLAGAAMAEFRNHDPLTRRRRRKITASILETVRHGVWPPGRSTSNTSGAT